MVETLLRLAMEKGADLAGWATLDRGELALYSLLDTDQANRFCSAFVIVKSHNPDVLKGLRGTPTEAYDQDYRRLNSELVELVQFFEIYLTGKGIACLAVNPSETLDYHSQRGLVSHRALAERAGIGMRGRNNLLVTYPYHSGVRICSLLTELHIPRISKPVWPHPCAECHDCLKACPVRAIGESPEEFRIDLCLMHLEKVSTPEISPQICGACLAACPRSTVDQLS